jgi:transposase
VKRLSRISGKRRFKKWRDEIPKEVAPAFQKFLKTVERWRKYIFNFFDYKVSNAYTESKNRDIKSLQRHGRRTSFIVLRARLLFMSVMRKPPSPKRRIGIRQIREAMKKAKEKR